MSQSQKLVAGTGLWKDSLIIPPSQGHGEVVGCVSTRSLHLSRPNISAHLPALMSPSSCLPSNFMCSVTSIPRHCSMGPFYREIAGLLALLNNRPAPYTSPVTKYPTQGARCSPYLIITIHGSKDTRMGAFLPPFSCNTPAPAKAPLLPTCAPKGPKLYLKIGGKSCPCLALL